MMQHHIGRARRVRACVIADDGIEAEHRLDQIALESLVEDFACGLNQQIEQGALVLDRELAQRACGF